jgi:hypothetical protein
MTSSAKTTNLKLSKFAPGDKPSWLTDYNADMQAIDNAFTTTAPIIPADDQLGLTAAQYDRLWVDASGVVRVKPVQ